MNKMWHLEDIDDNKIDNNVCSNLNPVFKRILFRRGLRTEKEINQFLYGSLEDLHDPFMLKDMKQAVDKIIEEKDKQTKIIVYGDYDVDGITGTSLLFNYFKKRVGIDIDYYIPDRQQEGYGLNLDAVKNIVNRDYGLLITVDCGITAIKEIEYAGTQGLDVIVTDHHQPAAE
ncbi:MAG: DHH family phosphoesterase, partial [Halanaerobiaceae bacterium]